MKNRSLNTTMSISNNQLIFAYRQSYVWTAILYSSSFICVFKHTVDALSKTERITKPCLLLRSSVFLKLGSAEPRVSASVCQAFRETEMHNGGIALLTVLNLWIRSEIRVATFATDHSATDSTQSINQTLLQSRSSLILQSSHSALLSIDSWFVRRNDQVIDRSEVSRWVSTCNVRKRSTNAGI